MAASLLLPSSRRLFVAVARVPAAPRLRQVPGAGGVARPAALPATVGRLGLSRPRLFSSGSGGGTAANGGSSGAANVGGSGGAAANGGVNGGAAASGKVGVAAANGGVNGGAAASGKVGTAAANAEGGACGGSQGGGPCSCAKLFMELRGDMITDNRKIWKAFSAMFEREVNLRKEIASLSISAGQTQIDATVAVVKTSYRILASGGAVILGLFTFVSPVVQKSWQQDTLDAIEKKKREKKERRMIHTIDKMMKEMKEEKVPEKTGLPPSSASSPTA